MIDALWWYLIQRGKKKKKKKTGTQFSSTASVPVPKDLTHKYLKCAWHAYETVN